MALTSTIQLIVTPLTDNEIWFADAESWSNYWRDLELEATFEGADNAVYTDVPFDTGLAYTNVASGVGMVCSQAQLESLLADYNALKASFKNMRTKMKDVGYIQQAQ